MQVGCDRILDSPLEEDQCGICAGDGSKCATQINTVRRKVGRPFTKVFVLPTGARGIEIQKLSGTDIYLGNTLKQEYVS